MITASVSFEICSRYEKGLIKPFSLDFIVRNFHSDLEFRMGGLILGGKDDLTPATLGKFIATGRFQAVLDVYEKEPLTKAETRLFDLPNVTLLPHQGGPTTDLRAYIARELLLESAAFLDGGKPLLHEITRQRAQYMSAH